MYALAALTSRCSRAASKSWLIRVRLRLEFLNHLAATLAGWVEITVTRLGEQDFVILVHTSGIGPGFLHCILVEFIAHGREPSLRLHGIITLDGRIVQARIRKRDPRLRLREATLLQHHTLPRHFSLLIQLGTARLSFSAVDFNWMYRCSICEACWAKYLAVFCRYSQPNGGM